MGRDIDIQTVTQVVIAMVPYRGSAFDTEATALRFHQAMVADDRFRARLELVHALIQQRKTTTIPRRMLVPLQKLFKELEYDAGTVLGRNRTPDINSG
jgi:hypothetical protein